MPAVRRSSPVLLFAWIAFACAVARLPAQPTLIPDAELASPPTATRLAALGSAAGRDGWAPQIAPLRAAALKAYERGNLLTAESWYHVYAWASVWGETEAHFVPRWISAVNTLGVGHSNMARTFEARQVPLGAALSPELQAWLLADRGFSQEFFSLVSPVDYLPRVFAILEEIHRSSPAKFQSYPGLALAIAVVFDVPPPPQWPHGQVSADALPRKLVQPAAAFAWWVRQDQLGRLRDGFRRRPAAELKFVVDAAAPLGELEWARNSITLEDGDLGRAYAMIRYKIERIKANQSVWPGRTYRLADILSQGGICADQAYFATEVGKARGVPTLLFHGAGNDARHAWIGYLDAQQRWQLDVARYAEQRFVTGYALDPQTWREFTDHELEFLREHFRALPSYRQSRVHQQFAADLLAAGNAERAAVSARQAVRFEPRNQAAWEILVDAEKQRSADPKVVEVVLREAALAFQRYPELEAYYVGRVVESLRARGQTSEAAAEERRIALKNQDTRVDISVQQARAIILRAIQTQALTEQVRTYNSVVDSFGPPSGISFCDEVVRIFVEHLIQLQHRNEALRAVDRARRTLRFEPNSQLDRELARLQRMVESVPPRA